MTRCGEPAVNSFTDPAHVERQKDFAEGTADSG